MPNSLESMVVCEVFSSILGFKGLQSSDFQKPGICSGIESGVPGERRRIHDCEKAYRIRGSPQTVQASIPH
jgi:hypothetical protein